MKKSVIRSSVAVILAMATFCVQSEEIQLYQKPQTGLGLVAIVNTQKTVSDADLESVAKLFRENTECRVEVKDKADGATIWLQVIDDKDKPVMLLAPEDHWGEVNVAKVVSDLKSDSAKAKFRAARTRKLIIKALSLLCGGGSSQFPGNIMNTATLRELDYIQDQLPMDMIDNYIRYFTKVGITQKVMMPYAEACQEGWAPAPTNDAQKAIWKELYTPPSNPIKIKFDPAKAPAK